jgi:hypothetical protein
LSPKVMYLFVTTGMRLENHSLSPVIWPWAFACEAQVHYLKGG